MKNPINLILPAILLIIGGVALFTLFGGEKETPSSAKKVLANFIAYERQANPIRLQGLYAPEAIIYVQEVSAESSEIIKEYTLLPRRLGEVAMRTESTFKNKNSFNRYTEINHRRVGNKVIVDAVRESNLLNYPAPHKLVLKMVTSDLRTKNWLISEEYIMRLPPQP